MFSTIKINIFKNSFPEASSTLVAEANGAAVEDKRGTLYGYPSYFGHRKSRPRSPTATSVLEDKRISERCPVSLRKLQSIAMEILRFRLAATLRMTCLLIYQITQTCLFCLPINSKNRISAPLD